jgi:hypothetical protein
MAAATTFCLVTRFFASGFFESVKSFPPAARSGGRITISLWLFAVLGNLPEPLFAKQIAR